MTMLYLIRHGETTWNAEGRIQGQQDAPLSELGHEQTQMAACAMAQHHFDAIYTSDLARAADTAAAIAAHHTLTPIPDIRLRELSFGAWEGLTTAEVAADWPEHAAAWRTDSLHTRPPGGETIEDIHRRVADVMTEVIARHPDGMVVIVGHGGSLRALITLALGADIACSRRIRLDNCSISVIEVTDGRHTLRQLNDCCHLHTSPTHASLDETGVQSLHPIAG